MKLPKAWPAIVIALFALATVFFATFQYAYIYSESSGTFGDTFGVATSFFSALTLVFLIIAVLYQREEISLVRDERDEFRKMLAGQEELNNLQRTALESQIENQVFYSIIRLISDETSILEQVDRSAEASAFGLARFSVGDSKISRAANHARKSLQIAHSEGSLENFSPKPNEEINHCRTLANLFRVAYDLIVEKGEWSREKRRYLWILQAYNTEQVALVWAYHALASKDTDRSLGLAFNYINDQELVSVDVTSGIKEAFKPKQT